MIRLALWASGLGAVGAVLAWCWCAHAVARALHDLGWYATGGRFPDDEDD